MGVRAIPPARQRCSPPADGGGGTVLPHPSDGRRPTFFDWTPIRYGKVIVRLMNLFYAGAYENEKRVMMVDGRTRKSYVHGRSVEDWDVLLRVRHEVYIDRVECERN